MQPVSRTPANPIAPAEEAGAESAPTTPYTVQHGDTLWRLAARLQALGLPGSREAVIQHLLALNPHVQDRDRLQAGMALRLPATGLLPERPGSVETGGHRVEAYVSLGGALPWTPAGEARGAGGPGMTAGALAVSRGPPEGSVAEARFQLEDGTRFEASADGTPRYKQNARAGEGGWGGVALNDGAATPATIGRAGCAMTSVAMALSKLAGRPITPDVLDRYLDANGGYTGGRNALLWSVASGVTGGAVTVTRQAEWSLARIDAELAAGRPVVIGVDSKVGSDGGPNGTDHWLCLTRRDPEQPDVYYANDPATGDEVRLRRQPGGGLVEERPGEGTPGEARRPYRTTGQWTAFSTSSTG